ncbi:MAG: hypothetical protein Q8J65_04175, partial [Nitrosomonadales bacterium]|nr:hypothetical protein [Nitrosomonadales bacterium]
MSKDIHWLVLVVIMFFAVAIPYSALNQPSGPVSEVVGVIETFGMVGKNSSVIASVRLNDNSLVQAVVPSGVMPLKGHVALVRVYQRTFSKTKTYEIYSAFPPAKSYQSFKRDA